ncbi:MAG: two-component regulator propeller domain-containing protein [Ignavibacteriota bacterium]
MLGRTAAIVACAALSAQLGVALQPDIPLKDLRARAWQTDSGLPHNSVVAVVQGADGYIWAGTEAGLVRFNGISFSIYDSTNTPAFEGDHVETLLSASDGSLWIGGLRGLLRLQNGHFERVRLGADVEDVRTLAEDAQHNLWIGTLGSGLLEWSGGRIRRFGAAEGLPENTIWRVVPGHDGSIWVGAQGGLFRGHDGVFSKAISTETLAANRIAGLWEDRDGTLWIGTHGGGACSFANGQLHRYLPADGLADRVVRFVRQDSAGAMWFATDHGLSRYFGGRFETFGVANGLPDERVVAVTEDREGRIWLGTIGGLVVLRQAVISERRLQPGMGSGPAAPDGAGNALLSTGTAVFRSAGDSTTPITTAQALHVRAIMAVAGDRSGLVWVGTENGLFAVAAGTPPRHVSFGPGRLNEIRFLSNSTGDGVVAATTGGVYRIRLSGNMAAERIDPESDSRSLLETRDGALWIGTNSDGLICVKGSQRRVYTTRDGLPNGIVTTLFEDSAGVLWAGTVGGLARFDSRRFVAFRTTDGLAENIVYQILDDGHGYLWLGGVKGLSRIRRADLFDGGARPVNLRHFGAADGMPSSECAGGPPARAGSLLWFGTKQGSALVDLSRPIPGSDPPPVVIEDCIVNRQHLDRGSVAHLPPGRSDLEVRYAGLNYTDPASVRYRYRLDGLDHNWVEAGSRREAFYTNLPPGPYVFRVSARNGDGEWTERTASVAFDIAPHFYQTWWFFGCSAIAVAAAVWWVHGIRLRRLAMVHAVALSERNRIARELHDTLLQGFTGLVLKMGALADRIDLPEAQQLESILLEADGYLREARRSIHAMRERDLPAAGFAQVLLENVGHLCPADVELCMRAAGTDRRLPRPLTDNLLGIAEEAVRNALLHAQCRRIEVDVQYRWWTLNLSVRDDGRGFDPTSKAPEGHYGITGMRERAAQMGGRLRICSEPGKGSQVAVRIPLAGAVKL